MKEQFKLTDFQKSVMSKENQEWELSKEGEQHREFVSTLYRHLKMDATISKYIDPWQDGVYYTIGFSLPIINDKHKKLRDFYCDGFSYHVICYQRVITIFGRDEDIFPEAFNAIVDIIKESAKRFTFQSFNQKTLKREESTFEIRYSLRQQ